MLSVLILGARAPVALEYARRFTRHGWRVVVADSIACRVSGWSSAVYRTERIAAPREHPLQFACDLTQLCTRYAIDLIVPTCEEVFFLSRYRDRLPREVRVLCDSFDKLREVHSKARFVELAHGCGAHVPASALVDSIEQARDWAQGNAIVLKPEYSRFGVHVRLYADGVPDNAAPLAPLGKWVAQQFVRGSEYCSYSVAQQGNLVAHSTYRPTWRINRSSSYYFEPARIDAIRDFAARFAQKLSFTGQLSFDWIQQEDGTVSVLECNPRATSGCHLFDQAAPLPAALAGLSTDCIEPDNVPPRMIAAVMLSAGLASALRAGRTRQWAHDVRRASDVIALPGDGRPVGGALLDLASYARLAFARRCSLRAAATRDIEWDGEPLPEP